MSPAVSKALIAKNQAQIDKQGRLAATRGTYLKRNVALFGAKKVLPASKTIAALLTKPGQPKSKSRNVTIGEAPNGFGKQVLWDADDSALALMIFLNASDSMGVMISGVKATDTIELVTAAGLASFAEDTENEGAGAIIGIVAAGANATAAAFGAPEAKPIIDAGAKFAESRFQEKKVKTKVRTAFGVEPGTGLKARQEGGVLVSLPAARETFYSGDGDHTERWIKVDGTRDDAHRPPHVKNAFFLRSGSANKRMATTDGDILIYPWDAFFSDNFGFYRLHMLVKRGSGNLPDPPVVD